MKARRMWLLTREQPEPRQGQTVLPLGIGTDAALNPKLWVGKYKYEDVNGDGFINASDQKVLGSPHPDFTGSTNFGLNYRNFDLSASFYFSVGNEIFNYSKWWTDFWSYEGNRSTTMRDKSWEPRENRCSRSRFLTIRMQSQTRIPIHTMLKMVLLSGCKYSAWATHYQKALCQR